MLSRYRRIPKEKVGRRDYGGGASRRARTTYQLAERRVGRQPQGSTHASIVGRPALVSAGATDTAQRELSLKMSLNESYGTVITL